MLEEQIFYAAVIARARLRSVSAAPTQRGDEGITCILDYNYGWRSLERVPVPAADAQRDDEGGGYYNTGTVYTFDVIEYLKGKGATELVVLESGLKRGPVVCRERFDTEEAALEAVTLAVERRDTRWEDREAIIFAWPNQDAVKGSYPYEFLVADPYRQSEAIFDKAWLPAAEAGGVEPVLGQAAGAMLFLSATPDSRVAEAAAPRTLAELRTLVAEAVEDYRTGSAEHGEEAYSQCLFRKYDVERRARWGPEYARKDYDMASGLAAGAEVIDPEVHGPNSGKTNPPIEYMGGRDAHLFNTDPDIYHTERPLPQGEYRFYYMGLGPASAAICGADVIPDAFKTSLEVFVHVTAPEGVLHEAFFDPVASGEAVGAGGAEIVLKPAEFTLKGSQTTIRRIEWESGRVVMRLEPDDNALADHHVDFIALDGSVALRLDFDDAAEATLGGAPALAWGVCNQPWSDGDLLMLRIRESEANLTGATGDADCLVTPPAPSPAADDTATTTPTQN